MRNVYIGKIFKPAQKYFHPMTNSPPDMPSALAYAQRSLDTVAEFLSATYPHLSVAPWHLPAPDDSLNNIYRLAQVVPVLGTDVNGHPTQTHVPVATTRVISDSLQSVVVEYWGATKDIEDAVESALHKNRNGHRILLKRDGVLADRFKKTPTDLLQRLK
jgi:hypothetical protein